MGEKKKKSNRENKEEKNDGGNDVTVVLRTDLHCEGCALKVVKCLRSFEGVETATVGDGQKITVVGQIDPIEIREKLEAKTHKKVELISPQIKSGNNKENTVNNSSNNKKSKGKEENSPKENANKKDKDKKKKESKDNTPTKDKPNEDEGDAKTKEKELPVTTAVFKVHLHCEGCIHKIYKTVTKTKGYKEIKFDVQKDFVTVTGAIDMKALGEALQKQLKKEVQIVQPNKKDGEKKDKGKGGEDKGNNNNGNEKMIADMNMVQYAPQVGYPNPNPFVYGSDLPQFNPYNFGSYHAPQLFSDENPNACSVM